MAVVRGVSVPLMNKTLKIILAICFVVGAYSILSKNTYVKRTRNEIINQLSNIRDKVFSGQNDSFSKVGTFRFHPVNSAYIEQEWAKFLEFLPSGTGRKKEYVLKNMIQKVPQYDLTNIRIHNLDNKVFTTKEVHALIHETNYRVPNAVHYVLLDMKEIQFHHLVCMLSGFWSIRPKAVLIWYNTMPSGKYWDYLVKNTTHYPGQLLFVQRPRKEKVYNVTISVKEHQSDVMRIEALLTFGGIYFDMDIVVVKPFEDLRNFSFTMGREMSYALCNSVLVSEPNSTFMAMWHVSYQLLDDKAWAGHSVLLPNQLHKKWSQLAHVEEESINRPNWNELRFINGKERVWNWRKKNYAVHLWYRLIQTLHTMATIKKEDSMLGDMFRFILFGTESMTAVANISTTL